MRQTRIQTMTRCAFGAALMAVCAWITIPGAVPFTLQTFGLFLLLELLGGRLGLYALAVYLALGVMGLPVFSGFQSGFGVILGATGGYLSGFLISAFVYIFLEKTQIPPVFSLILSLIGCYGFGTVWYLAAYAEGGSLWAVLSVCVLPFLIPDAVKLLLAHSLSKRLKPFINPPR